MKTYRIEVEDCLSQYSKANAIEYSGLQKWRIAVPVLRSIVKQKPFSFQSLTATEQLVVWNHIWQHSRYFEVMSIAMYPFQHKSLQKHEFDTLIHWIERCSCWEHSDDLSKIYAQVLEENPNWILPIYKEWNQSDNLWKRRQSIVGLLEYASKRKKVLTFKELISFVQPLLVDEAYYVQKGIGWALREIYNIYPQETIQFMERNLLQLSPIAYSAATEKLGKELKEQWNLTRKSNRNARDKTKR